MDKNKIISIKRKRKARLRKRAGGANILVRGFGGVLGIVLLALLLVAAAAARAEVTNAGLVGLAVDDSIHYLARYRRAYLQTMDAEAAMRITLIQVGPPIVATSLAISMGFSILMFSNFSPTAVFGMLMMLAMALALFTGAASFFASFCERIIRESKSLSLSRSLVFSSLN